MMKLQWLSGHPIPDQESREKLYSMRRHGVLTDMSLSSEKRIYPCHKIILTCASPYIHALQVQLEKSDSKQLVVAVGDHLDVHMRYLLEYIYLGTLLVDPKDFQLLSNLANRLLIPLHMDRLYDPTQMNLKLTALHRETNQRMVPNNGKIRNRPLLALEDTKVKKSKKREGLPLALLDEATVAKLKNVSTESIKVVSTKLKVQKEQDLYVQVQPKIPKVQEKKIQRKQKSKPSDAEKSIIICEDMSKRPAKPSKKILRQNEQPKPNLKPVDVKVREPEKLHNNKRKSVTFEEQIEDDDIPLSYEIPSKKKPIKVKKPCKQPATVSDAIANPSLKNLISEPRPPVFKVPAKPSDIELVKSVDDLILSKPKDKNRPKKKKPISAVVVPNENQVEVTRHHKTKPKSKNPVGQAVSIRNADNPEICQNTVEEVGPQPKIKRKSRSKKICMPWTPWKKPVRKARVVKPRALNMNLDGLSDDDGSKATKTVPRSRKCKKRDILLGSETDVGIEKEKEDAQPQKLNVFDLDPAQEALITVRPRRHAFCVASKRFADN